MLTSPAAADARKRLPREPYPGLRPFLDFEAALLFGRERQVREVIERLRETQFVAVLGGSGSGKSSLIHAGVVPELRSFGIPGAGDLWLPMTCTPGTNVSAADSRSGRHTPITRFVRRFAGLLKSRGDEAADQARLAEMAEVFRQEAGFARLMDTYAAELDVPPGPDPAEARVLFVLDQFEEIFHPTNKGEPGAGLPLDQGKLDAILLVERVLDHFFNPHPHAYVVLTMRSEHLNDCAAFLELPDAINKSSYLIRRLDPQELLAAITDPAQRFLRLVARSEAGARALPELVKFEQPVLDRLLRDVQAITHDPDHLPLLQHLLARLWEAALEREEMDVPVPGHVTEIDLVRAVSAGLRSTAPGDEEPLDERTNTLRACVENWPESVYRWHDPAQQQQLDALMRRLAFKDPNTGLYSQQRIEVDEAAALLGPGKTRADLRALIAEGFLGSVDYLYWDDDDPGRVTLKVSHESFIRGWSRFRQLIDAESERFDEFVGVLRKCSAWVASGHSEDFLLETGEMRRLRESDFAGRLADERQRAAWFRFLLLDRDGPRLARLQDELNRYMATSAQRLRERERRLGRSRRNWLMLGALTLLLAPSAMFSTFIQGPVTERAELLFDAGNRANRAQLTPDYPGVGAAAGALDSLLRAAELIDEARSGQGTVMARISEGLLDRFAWIPPVQRQDAFLRGVAAQSEPPVNGKLRQLLATALWRGDPAPAEGVQAPAEPAEVECEPDGSEVFNPGTLRGRVLLAGSNAAPGEARRAIFVQQAGGVGETAVALRGANIDAALRCQYGPVVLSVPLRLRPALVFDSLLRYVLYSTSGEQVEVASVTMHELDWERAEGSRRRVVQTQLRSVVTDDAAVQAVRNAAGPGGAAVMPGWRVQAGRALEVDRQPWRVVTMAATRLAVPDGDGRFQPLAPAAPGSPCRRLEGIWPEQPGFRTDLFDHAEHCFAITRGLPPDEAADPGAPRREQVLVAVYESPAGIDAARLAENPPAPVASLAPFARIGRTDDAWQVGVAGEYAGWLALRSPDRSGQQRLLGAPWSTCALWRLGKALQQRNPPPAPPPGTPPRESPPSDVCADR